MRAILTYHSIDPSGSPVSVHPAAFARHVAFLASGAVRVVPLTEIGRVPVGETALAVTFDDAFQNFATDAWPLLRDAGVPATVFAVTGRMGSDNAWGGVDEPGIPRLPLMDWDALGRTAEEGAEVGAHSRSHPRFTGLGRERLAEEVEGSFDDLRERLGVVPRSFCYPYGDVDAASALAVGERFDVACTTELRVLRDSEDRVRLPRLDAYYLQGRGRLEGFGSAGFRRYLALRALLRDLRARLRPSPRPHGSGQGSGPGRSMDTMAARSAG